MKLDTSRFGTLEISEKEIIYFPEGLYGFEKETEFTLLPFKAKNKSPFFTFLLSKAKSLILRFLILDKEFLISFFNNMIAVKLTVIYG